jgi:hypothetical protein
MKLKIKTVRLEDPVTLRISSPKNDRLVVLPPKRRGLWSAITHRNDRKSDYITSDTQRSPRTHQQLSPGSCPVYDPVRQKIWLQHIHSPPAPPLAKKKPVPPLSEKKPAVKVFKKLSSRKKQVKEPSKQKLLEPASGNWDAHNIKEISPRKTNTGSILKQDCDPAPVDWEELLSKDASITTDGVADETNIDIDGATTLSSLDTDTIDEQETHLSHEASVTVRDEEYDDEYYYDDGDDDDDEFEVRIGDMCKWISCDDFTALEQLREEHRCRQLARQQEAIRSSFIQGFIFSKATDSQLEEAPTREEESDSRSTGDSYSMNSSISYVGESFSFW